ncbi:hypothetical protein CHS0354_006755 [Potamilus streckersoni]|uniref:Uncharacterized protein n=1 Tax=Potamilus streckersoni TaxID=2493646 RepID=A0AAE0VRA9_9BIVA|nr:hypothetical protein CHS0354_006755 [Potamilus streckersoni]
MRFVTILSGLVLFSLLSGLQGFGYGPVASDYNGGSSIRYILPLLFILPLLGLFGSGFGGTGGDPAGIDVNFKDKADALNDAYSSINATAFAYYNHKPFHIVLFGIKKIKR